MESACTGYGQQLGDHPTPSRRLPDWLPFHPQFLVQPKTRLGSLLLQLLAAVVRRLRKRRGQGRELPCCEGCPPPPHCWIRTCGVGPGGIYVAWELTPLTPSLLTTAATSYSRRLLGLAFGHTGTGGVGRRSSLCCMDLAFPPESQPRNLVGDLA